MKVLVSPVSPAEAQTVCAGGADIVDIKNVNEGSLGASFPWIIQGVLEAVRGYSVETSATLGDLAFKPGTASLAAYGAASLGVDYVKAGLYGVHTREDAAAMMRAIVRACRQTNPETQVVAAGYADYRRFDGLPAEQLVQAAGDAGADMVMLDTAIKDGQTLFDALSLAEMQDFVGAAKETGLKAALAGSIQFEHIEILRRLDPAFVGIRGCVCVGADRTTEINLDLVRKFVAQVRGTVLAG